MGSRGTSVAKGKTCQFLGIFKTCYNGSQKALTLTVHIYVEEKRTKVAVFTGVEKRL